MLYVPSTHSSYFSRNRCQTNWLKSLDDHILRIQLPSLVKGAQVFRGLSPVSVNKLPEVPIQLKIMKRSPKDILQNKQNLVSAVKSSAFQKPFDEILQLPQNSVSAPQSTKCKNSFDVNSDFLQKVEEEITSKLAILEILDFGNKGFDLTQLHTVKELEALKYLLYVNRSKVGLWKRDLWECEG